MQNGKPSEVERCPGFFFYFNLGSVKILHLIFLKLFNIFNKKRKTYKGFLTNRSHRLHFL